MTMNMMVLLFQFLLSLFAVSFTTPYDTGKA